MKTRDHGGEEAVTDQWDKWTKNNSQNLKVIFYALDKDSHLFAFGKINEARAGGVNADIYPEPVKLRKIWEHAEKRQVPFVVIIGDEERDTGMLTIKDMTLREVKKMSINELIEFRSSLENTNSVIYRSDLIQNSHYFLITVTLNPNYQL